MKSLHELTAPIAEETLPREDAQTLRRLLAKLQGNILKGHGRDHSVHIMLRFEADTILVKEWIAKFAKYVTSAQRQLQEAKRYHDYKIPGRVFRSFFLTARGYSHLGFDPAGKPGFDQQAFLHGMKAARHRLNDLHQDVWCKGYRQDIHAMILLADNDEHLLSREASRWLSDVSAFATVCAVERGRVMRNVWGKSIEHFGYVDSDSQPLFFQNDIDQAKDRGNRMHFWDSGAGPDVVLAPDPFGQEEVERSEGEIVHHSGSYLVFRKLEQNVRKYKESELELAKALGLSAEDAKRAGALLVGRFEDGTPIVLQSTPGRPTNDFNYNEDPDGEKCPLQAHIRKVDPRQGSMPRIVRRGITYGKRWKEPKDHPSLEELPSKDVGLLFMCYQRSIEKQFEVLQSLWANDPRLPYRQEPGIDPIIGQPGGLGAGQQKWSARWNDPREKHRLFNIHGSVTLKGGEYFFAPSIYFLENIQKDIKGHKG